MNRPNHTALMRRCLDLAQRGAGAASPNPMVGAVLVNPDGQVLGEGWHQRFGEPHAEANAIAEAEARHGAGALQTATMYVNLEPCSHYGKTPPCSLQILEKQIPRVVVGMIDPFPKVAGRGLAQLREQGVEVITPVLETECQRLNEAFIHHVKTGRPFVMLKVAQTLGGHIATASGDSQWISGPDSLQKVHQWRAELDAVLIGSGTAAADNPALTVRHVQGRSPWRIILDNKGVLSPDLQIFTDDLAQRTIIVTNPKVQPPYAKAFTERGGIWLKAPVVNGHLDLPAVLTILGAGDPPHRPPFQSLLVEAGRGLATAFFQARLVNRLAVTIAPKLVGDGLSWLGALGIEKMADALTFTETQWEPCGDDLIFHGWLSQ